MVRTVFVTPYATFSLVSGPLPATTSLGVSYMTAVACDSPTTLHIKGHNNYGMVCSLRDVSDIE